MVFRIHRQGQRQDAVATGSRLQRVAKDAADTVVLSAPVVRSLACADRDRRVHVVGRVHDEREVVAAVAARCGLQVEAALARGDHRDAAPDVRQCRVADGVGLLEVVARVHRHTDAVDILTSVVVVHRVGIEARLGDGAATPLIAAARTHHDWLAVIDIRRVHRQGQHIDAVAAGSRRQGVIVRTRLGERTAAPTVLLIAADGGRLVERVSRINGQGQAVNNITTGSGNQRVGI